MAHRSVIQRRLSYRTNTQIFHHETETTSVHAQQNKEEPKNMNEGIVKTLTMKDPHYGKNKAYFSYQDMNWKVEESDDQYLKVLDMASSILHKNDKQASAQNEYHRKKNLEKRKVKKESEEEYKEKESDSIRSMRNQLTYAQRTSQSFNPVIIEREVETVKLERNNHSGIMHKWDLFDRYLTKYVVEEEENRRKNANKFGLARKERGLKKVEKNTESLSKPSMMKTLKLVERQIMQILNANSYYLYREWSKQEDSTDSKLLYMLLPFPQMGSIRRSVTAMCWNPRNEDLFAIGYGSYAFPKKKDDKDKTDDRGEERSDDIMESGYIYVFSIKNNYYPEIKYTTDTSVLSLDFHPTTSSMLVAGLYDGSVVVYNIQQKIKTPIITCDLRYQRHMDPVWQVKWYNSIENDEYIFYSISSDGKVVRWSFFKNKTKLESEEMVVLRYSDNLSNQLPEGTQAEKTLTNVTTSEHETKDKVEDGFIYGNAGGMCFDFNKHKGFEHFFVLGTEEGQIHLCSVKHRGHLIETYEGHTMGVYTVTWNPYHPKIFASCSADWTIKIWHYKVSAPLIIFDMQTAVGDVAWSPWCSTIFAAVTVAGEMKFFDLNRNRKSHIESKKYQDIAINHIAFNKFENVFLTGNEKGKVRLWRMAEPLWNTIDKKEEEQKVKEKNQGNNQKANLPVTKVNVPKNLMQKTTKKKKVAQIKKENKLATTTSEPFMKEEKERIIAFLRLLDVEDV